MSVRSLRYNTIEQHFTKGVTASTDRDALAFLEAAQIYNTNQQRAIVNLVRSLKRVGLWSKMKAIYPFIGGTATSHKWNLKDPRDVDAAFRLTFSGGWTHSATGADPNGTNGYADTYCNASSNLLQNSTHLSYYSTEDSVDDTEIEIGYDSSTGDVGSLLQIDAFKNFPSFWGTYSRLNSAATFTTFLSNAGGKGLWLVSRRSSADIELYKNSASVASGTTSSKTPANLNIFIGNQNADGSPTASYYTSKQCAFATIGDGLTDTDATNLYNIVDLYQKRLGRAV